MADSKENNVESDATLTAVEVHIALTEERFRDACQAGDLDAVKSILHGCTETQIHDIIHRTSSCTGTPLFDAILSQQLNIVEYIVEQGYNLEMECDVNIFYPIFFRDKCTALCLACAVGDVPITKLLLENKASVNHSSVHSSPVIYASEYNNTDLMSLLLEYGADVNQIPQGLKTEAAVLPLYQACLSGYKDTADLLFYKSNVQLDQDKRICLLGLLGAQCINKNSDYVGGLKYWKDALVELEKMKQEDGSADTDLVKRLQQLYIRGSNEVSKQVPCRENSLSGGTIDAMFKDMKLCTTVEELDAISSDEKALHFQGLLVLESILGPSHHETTQQVSQAARLALERGDLGTACKLFLYIIDSNESRGQTATATEYTSQFADLLLNVFTSQPDELGRIENICDILLLALTLVQKGVCKLLLPDIDKTGHVAQSTINNSPSSSNNAINTEATYSYFDSQMRSQSKLRLLVELIETFMAFLCMIVKQDCSAGQQRSLKQVVAQFIELKVHKAPTKLNLESELFKIAVYGGQCTSSTLYFFQEELFPNPKVLQLLLKCGGNVNCQDTRGDSPLHYATDCPEPKADVIRVLIDHDAHIDICNRYRLTPYSLLQKMPQFGVQPFQLTSLKCLVSRTIMNHDLPYIGIIPTALNDFVAMHGVPKGKINNKKTEDIK